MADVPPASTVGLENTSLFSRHADALAEFVCASSEGGGGVMSESSLTQVEKVAAHGSTFLYCVFVFAFLRSVVGQAGLILRVVFGHADSLSLRR